MASEEPEEGALPEERVAAARERVLALLKGSSAGDAEARAELGDLWALADALRLGRRRGETAPPKPGGEGGG